VGQPDRRPQRIEREEYEHDQHDAPEVRRALHGRQRFNPRFRWSFGRVPPDRRTSLLRVGVERVLEGRQRR
jgi:hypothetical protein